MYIRAIIFDYGGTIDTASTHWSEVLWEAFQASGIDVTKEQFREAYVHGERTLAREPLIKPQHTMLDLLRIKDTVRVHVSSESHLKVVSRRSAKGELQINVVDVGLVYHHVRRDLSIGKRRHRHLCYRELDRPERKSSGNGQSQ